jgi:hypothetical protein
MLKFWELGWLYVMFELLSIALFDISLLHND